MKSYLELVSKYQQATPRKTWLTIFSVALAVALVTTIFSMADVFQRTMKIQALNGTGNYHLLVENVTPEEAAAIRSRVDVQNSGEWIAFESGAINGMDCQIAAIAENFAPNMQVEVVEGQYPTRPNELMLERWALEAFQPPLRIGDRVTLRLADGQTREYLISGLFSDFSSTQAKATPGVLLSMAAAQSLDVRKVNTYLIEFKDHVSVLDARKSIQSTLHIPDERIGQNEKLLAAMGQSRNQSVLSLYATAAGLFIIVLVAAVVMIYNTFNISVMERVRQFGLLRCLGASKSQIQRIVRGEGLRISLHAIPLGALVGVLIAFACSALLKFYNSNLFGEMPLFVISLPGLAAGVLIGFLTVLAASFAPANRAASISPVNAVTGSNEIQPSLKKKSSLFTRLFRMEIALGVNNAVARKRTLLLMSASVALSIILFMGFNVFIQFMYSSMRTTKPYTPDLSILAPQGISNGLYAKIGALTGVKRVYGRMFGYVNASFDARLLTQRYLGLVGGVQAAEGGRFVPPEQSWLISYDANQLGWARQDLVAGNLDEAALNQGNGIVAVISNLRHSVSTETVNWHVGDRVVIDSPTGPVEKRVMAILREVPFSDSNLNLTALITTEKQFVELTGDTTLDVIDIQLTDRAQEHTAGTIRAMLGSNVSLHDLRQRNSEVDQAFFSMAVFVYGFVIVIALISVLNVLNTIQTSVAAKTRYLGVMRAVGMTGPQLSRMVLAEVGVYNLLGCLAGTGLGLLLQNQLATDALAFAHIRWYFPWAQVAVIAALMVLVTGLSTIQPMRMIKRRSVTDVIGTL